ncbi:MAG: hypothetical protein JWR69_2832, partial [Pedosphaera sp.]|nr:hypothetical protein [Pedosphaera sp.]
QAYFRKRYLTDLSRSRPAVFIDAVAAGAFIWFWQGTEKHETFPELANFIDANYTLCKSIQIEPDGAPVRIYLLKQRAEKLRSLSAGAESPANPASSVR